MNVDRRKKRVEFNTTYINKGELENLLLDLNNENSKKNQDKNALFTSIINQISEICNKCKQAKLDKEEDLNAVKSNSQIFKRPNSSSILKTCKPPQLVELTEEDKSLIQLELRKNYSNRMYKIEKIFWELNQTLSTINVLKDETPNEQSPQQKKFQKMTSLRRSMFHKPIIRSINSKTSEKAMRKFSFFHLKVDGVNSFSIKPKHTTDIKSKSHLNRINSCICLSKVYIIDSDDPLQYFAYRNIFNNDDVSSSRNKTISSLSRSSSNNCNLSKVSDDSIYHQIKKEDHRIFKSKTKSTKKTLDVESMWKERFEVNIPNSCTNANNKRAFLNILNYRELDLDVFAMNVNIYILT